MYVVRKWPLAFLSIPLEQLLCDGVVWYTNTYTNVNRYVNNSYVPQTEPEGQMLLRLGSVTNLLDVTPSNPMPHPLPSPPILLCYLRSKNWLLSNIQQTKYVHQVWKQHVHQCTQVCSLGTKFNHMFFPSNCTCASNMTRKGCPSSIVMWSH